MRIMDDGVVSESRDLKGAYYARQYYRVNGTIHEL